MKNKLFPILGIVAMAAGCLPEKGEQVVKNIETQLTENSNINKYDVDTLQHGPWVEFYEGTDSVFGVGSYENGEETGYWTYYHENGNKLAEGRYKTGEETGEWIHYHENGAIETVGSYENGEETGNWIEYDENGKKVAQGSYKKGKKDGPWRFWDENGQRSESIFRDGNEIGTE